MCADTPCRSCQYNLRALRVDALCPECGTPVALSLRDDRLQFSNPDWLITLRRGLLIYVLSWFLTVPYFALMLVASRGPARYELWGPAGTLLLSLISTIGMWFAATPDPRQIGENSYGTVRRLLRVGLVISLINHLSQFPLRIVQYLPTTFVWLDSIEMSAVTLLVVVCFLLYVSRFALRIPDERLSRHARFLTFAVGFTSGSSVVFNIWLTHPTANLMLRYIHYLWIPSIVFGLTAIVFGLLQIVLCLKLAGRLREAIALAQQHTQLIRADDQSTVPQT